MSTLLTRVYPTKISPPTEFFTRKTALLKIQNDIATSMDKGAVVGLVLLNLSAAFNIIDHSILFNCRQHWYGIDGVFAKVGSVIPRFKETADQNRWTSFRCFSTLLWGSSGLSSGATQGPPYIQSLSVQSYLNSMSPITYIQMTPKFTWNWTLGTSILGSLN